MGKDKRNKKDRKDKKRKRDKDDEEDYRKAEAERLVRTSPARECHVLFEATSHFVCMHSIHASLLPTWKACLHNDHMQSRASHVQAKRLASHLKKHSGGHGYTDQDNPFGDSNVTERFVWGKKLEKQIQSGVNVKDLGAKAEKRRQEERLVCAS